MYSYYHSLIVLSFVPLITTLILNSGDPKNVLTTETIVRKHGYPFEKHTVQTEDGYILEIHRIPNLKSSQVAFLMHCLLCSSSDWVVSGKKNSLAYILHRAGYDVWLGNARGNTYSLNHTKYNPRGQFADKYWDFSWHEIGFIDLPTMLDYVQQKTGVTQMRYFAHSQGTANFFVLTSLKPQYNKIFKSAHLLAPIAFLNNSFNIFLKVGGNIVGRSEVIQTLLGSNEFRPSRKLQELVGSILCTDFSRDRVLCDNAFFLVAGFTNETCNHDIIPEVMASSPAGSSLNQVLHFVQEFVSGHFRQYDHGLEGNMQTYGSSEPPDYPLANINVPMFFYHGKADNFATVKDVLRLSKKLKTLVGRFESPIANFDHLAHMFSPNLAEKIHKYIMRDIALIN
ncbi:lipase 3-like [Eupeodes corollae]|uniref:lipase 3-like n=1 Tax=Eupeodes corollae TaxID=290404 RepID=UPI002490DC32|nr:lipase 3-like [Eupeodes corollae]